MSITKDAVAELRGKFDGRVVVPDEAGYEAARTVFCGGIERRPAAIVRAPD